MARQIRTTVRAVVLAALLLAGAGGAEGAERHAFVRYGAADGLASTRVTSLLQDSRGYLWIGTFEGLCRFDGTEFVRFGPRDGLGSLTVWSIAEDHAGRVWAATNAGISVQRTAPGPAFETYDVGRDRENIVVGVCVDERGAVWCDTLAGLYRAVPGGGAVSFEVVRRTEDPEGIQGVGLAAARGRFWRGMRGEVLAFSETGVAAYRLVERGPGETVVAIAEVAGRLLAATTYKLFEFDESGAWREVPVALERDQELTSIAAGPGGEVWLGTNRGLVRLDGGRQTVLTRANGLAGDDVQALLADREGNLWIGSNSLGLSKLAPDSIVSFTPEQTLAGPQASRVVASPDGRIFATAFGGGVYQIADDRVETVADERAFAFANRRLLADRRGALWIGTDEGLYRIAPGARRPERVAGLPAGIVFDGPGLYEAPDGAVWVGQSGSLSRFDPAGGVERYTLRAGEGLYGVLAMIELAPGRLLLASYQGTAWFDRGRLTPATGPDGLPGSDARSFLLDSRGRLWVGRRYGGVAVADDPLAERPAWRALTTADGLASDVVWSIAEDASGRIYFATGRGLDRLDPATGRIRHFDSSNGLAGDTVFAVCRDGNGRIWVGTNGGVSRLALDDDPLPAPIPVYLKHLQVAGEEIPLGTNGVTSVPGLRLGPSQDSLLVEFVAVTFRGARSALYQYKLEGVDADWSAPSEARSVTYARLAPGSYRFLVRAVTRDGAASAAPAELAFEIAPPIWQRWWFLTLAAAAVAAAALALHRARLRQVVAMERVRHQIATDLHDDVGAGLSQVAIMSEVARRDAAPPAAERFAELAGLARGMRDAMGDIVWAVDPHHDSVADLVRRMRAVALAMLEDDGRRVEFSAPDEAAVERLGLAPDRRRHVLLVFKEAVANAARHSRAQSVRIEVRVDGRALYVAVEDDGVGFDASANTQGTGLRSMRRRAEELGARIEVDSEPGRGTRVRLSVSIT
jgi:ligand-binding sensor domain-containing protein/signal transduction histidine kinase